MKLDEIFRNQIAVTHINEMIDKLEEIQYLIKDDKNRLISVKTLLKELVDTLSKETSPEWKKYLKKDGE